MNETIYTEDDCLFQVKSSDKKRLAESRIREMLAEGADIHPVKVPARGKIAKTFWGHLWCRHLESYEDMGYRVDLGRSHARTNSVIDLRVEPGKIYALVVDSETHEVVITVKPICAGNLESLSDVCSREVNSVIDLLSGRLSDEVMTALTSRETTIFPTPKEIKFSCNCLDYADMCMHSAATLYALSVVGDGDPEVFFRLRGINSRQLMGQVGASFLSDQDSESVTLNSDDLSALFNIDLVDS
jgi:uncharacterized Zn finger protein